MGYHCKSIYGINSISERKKRIYNRAHELVIFFQYLNDNSKDLPIEEISLSTHRIYIITSKLLHLSKISDIKKYLDEPTEQEYYNYLNKGVLNKSNNREK